MNTQEALLRSICLVPEDDARRLAYADWLSEFGGAAGEVRAALIDAQCAEARAESGGRVRGPAMAALKKRAADAWGAAAEDFVSGLPFPADAYCLRATANRSVESAFQSVIAVHRGFVSGVFVAASQLLGEACVCGVRPEAAAELKARANDRHCTQCKGTGVTGGCRDALFRLHPVTEVTLRGREPFKGALRWSWYSEGDRQEGDAFHPASDLPPDVFGELAGVLAGASGKAATSSNARAICFFSTQAKARADASQAAVNLCRRGAGLPRLTH